MRFTFLLLFCAGAAHAQDSLATYSDAFEARVRATQPIIRYTVRVAPAIDPEGYAVEMRLRNVGDTLRLALPVWAPGAYRIAMFSRYLRDLSVETGGRTVAVAREDSSTWRAVVGDCGERADRCEIVVRYRIAYPSSVAASTANNRSFLRETGALIDGPLTYLYLPGQTLAPSHVRFELPEGWRIATGLVPTADPKVFFAPSYDVLIDSPVLMGSLRVWSFAVEGVPHRVAWWLAPDAARFDTAAFVRVVERIVRAERDIMHRLPYRDYTFLYVDGAGGGLEHLNSTTIGISSASLAADTLAHASVTAHEFFHLWNVKRIRPAVLGPFDYQHPVRTTSLWWSEGVTDFFANEVLRHAGLAGQRAARETLGGDIASYLGNPASSRVAPERSSWSEWDGSQANDGYYISYYLQGALLGELLEIRLREATAGRRGMDDVIRALLDRYAGRRGFTGEDLLNTVNGVCGCDQQSFFDRHVSGSQPFPFDSTLAALGWRLAMHRGPATDSMGRPRADLRLTVSSFGGIGSRGGAAGGRPRLAAIDPTSAWGRAGLMMGDELIAVNGRPISGSADLRAALAGVRLGDVVRVEYVRGGQRRTVSARVGGYEEVRAEIVELPAPSERQLGARRRWLTGR